MSRTYEKVFIRLAYSLKESKNNTIILGAGCSLSSSVNNISFKALMEKSLVEHGITNVKEYDWDKLYQEFINIAWEGKGEKERKELLKKVFINLNPAEGYKCLRSLIENGIFTAVITTNVDMLLEKSFEGLSYRKRVHNGEYVTIGDNPTFDLIKVHGDLENGELKFSPAELMKLPDDLQEDINSKTQGPVIIIGYKGQDHGFMNSLNRTKQYACYWADINELDICDPYTIRPVTDFMNSRNSEGNYLFGEEYGNFDRLLKKIHSHFLGKNKSNKIQMKEEILGSAWRNTTIVDMLKLYNRLYELFLDVLDISTNKLKELCYNLEDYNEYLYSYLYYFNNQKLPLNLLQIPNNEVDALILGLSLDFKIKSTYYNIDENVFIEKVKNDYISTKTHPLTGSDFWNTISDIVCCNNFNKAKITIDMNNNLELISYEIPISELNELIRVASFLSLFIPFQSQDIHKKNNEMREFLCEKYDKIMFNDNKIMIDLGEVDNSCIEKLICFCKNTLPDTQAPLIKWIKSQKWIILQSKWIEIQLTVNEQLNKTTKNEDSFFNMCKERATNCTDKFLQSSSQFGVHSNVHTVLKLEYDIKKFINSEKSAMFVIGTSGRGKTVALKSFVADCKNSHEIFTIVISPKNTTINRYGLELFLDFKFNKIEELDILKHINTSLELRRQQLVLIFDGINEIDNIFKYQTQHYSALVKLAESIYSSGCKNIKLIVTCRESVYYNYQSSANLYLNPIYFFHNEYGVKENKNNNDYAYKINSMSINDKNMLMEQYGLVQDHKKHNHSLIQLQEYILKSDITPLFIAAASEAIKENVGTKLYNSSYIYDAFVDLIIKRLDDADLYIVYKIIYTYFDLVIEYRNTGIQITSFKIMDYLQPEYHNSFEIIISKMQDSNILAVDYSKIRRIKFAHDKIEESFFKQYIIEFEKKDSLFWDNIIELCQKNIIYRKGIIQYFCYLIDKKEYKKFKKISLLFSVKNINIYPNVIVETLSYYNDLNAILTCILDEDHKNESKKMYGILIIGIQNSISLFSVHNFNLNKVINSLLEFKSSIISDTDLSYMNYFKSKALYFKGDFENALEYIDKAKERLGKKDGELKSDINLQAAIVLMEQGYSLQSVELLNKEYIRYKKIDDFDNIVKVGIELGRALLHSGQVTSTLKLYDTILTDERSINNRFVLSKLYERKANALNKLMFHIFQYGTEDIDISDINLGSQINELFDEAISLYQDSIKILHDINDMFTYTGVAPEIINTYVSYSIVMGESLVEKCDEYIEEMDKLLCNILSPFKADYYLSKAFYYEYHNNLIKANMYIEKALKFANEMNIKNKIAKCNSFYAFFAYRCIKKFPTDIRCRSWLEIGTKRLNQAIEYYKRYTIVKNNLTLEDIIVLKKKYEKYLL